MIQEVKNMKKLFSLILVFIIIFTLGNFSFAAKTKTDTNNEVTTYNGELAGGDKTSSYETLDDETVARGLPKTGGIPAEAFYAAGAVLVLAALILSRKKVKTDTKN
jgi:hypothetical protein